MRPGAPSTALPDATPIAVAFARVARGVGLEAPVGSVVTLARSLAATGVASERSVYWAGRICLVRRPDEIEAYDSAFRAFWHGIPLKPRPDEELTGPTVAVDADDAGGTPEHGSARQLMALRYSPVEVLRHRDFKSLSAEELAESFRLIDRMRADSATRQSGRRVSSRRQGTPLDLRRTVRNALRTRGEPVLTVSARRASIRRSLVLVCDVSGSMEPYSRALLRFVHSAVVGRRRVFAFALGTRLTPISRELSSRDPDAALARAAAAVEDQSGGTRLGAGIAELNDRYGARGMARGAVVVILSDGWDRGEPELLERAMARLARMAHRVVWVNPLKASPGFAPVARGMAAALPYVDEFVEGHTVASLESLAEVIGR